MKSAPRILLPAIFTFVSLIILSACAKKTVLLTDPWQALHLLNYNTDRDLEQLSSILPQLSKKGVNVLFLEIDYHLEFESHPELRQGKEQISKRIAGEFAQHCKDLGIRLIPQFQCFGHQSWAKETYPLLTVYPELDLTPGAFADNKDIYCREWDPYNPRVNKIVFALMDEIIDAFQADAIHVGMDEVFLITSDFAPSTNERDPAEVYAKVVNDMYDHLVRTRGVEMLMWGDRFINASDINYGEWEAANNGTAPAIEMVPNDIIICDWHYEPREAYESVPLFLEKGFRVLPSGWKNVKASQAFISYSHTFDDDRMLGHLFTTWSKMDADALLAFEPMVRGLTLIEELNSQPKKH